MKELSLGELAELKKILTDKKLACIVVRPDGTKVEITGMGIAPAIRLLENGDFADAIVVDKIVGKAVAMLMSLGGVYYVHGVVMSQSAIDWLTQKKIPFSYDTAVENIVNRTGRGVCPMEETVKFIPNEATALEALKKKVEELRTKSNI